MNRGRAAPFRAASGHRAVYRHLSPPRRKSTRPATIEMLLAERAAEADCIYDMLLAALPPGIGMS